MVLASVRFRSWHKLLTLNQFNMLLSDKLIELGLEANPKNNQSMHEQEFKMLKQLEEALKTSTIKHLYKVVEFVCDHLNRKGYPYYNVNHFFTRSK